MSKPQLQILTALGPNDPDDGPEGRQARGMAIAAAVNVKAEEQARLRGPLPVR